MNTQQEDIARVLQGKPVTWISVHDVPKNARYAQLRKWAEMVFDFQGGFAINPILGKVLLDSRSVRDSLAHGGANLYKAAAFQAIKAVLELGVVVLQNTEGAHASTYVAAPVSIDKVENIVTVLVHTDSHIQRMYLHAVTTKENLLTARVSSSSVNSLGTDSGSTQSGAVRMILHEALTANLQPTTSQTSVPSS